MEYKRFGKTEMMISGLGIGTNRFDVEDTKTEAGLKKIEEIICHAVLNKGINYIDVAHTYIGGKAEMVLKHIYPVIKQKCFISSKVTYREDKTMEQAYDRIVRSIRETGVEYYDIVYVWCVYSYDEFLKICAPGGIYDGIIKAKQEGLVKHIGFSSHATPEDTIKIMESNLFEAVIISFNANNYAKMQSVVKRACELDVGILSMNSLAGGLIPKNEGFFRGIMLQGETISTAALRFVYESGIHCALSSMETIEKIEENCQAFENYVFSKEKLAKRIDGLVNNGLENICIGCNYCAGCPQKIPIKDLLQAYNARLFNTDQSIKNRTDEYLKKSLQIFDVKQFSDVLVPDDINNPCIGCGKCESVCTQSLPIIKYLQDIYNRATISGFTKKQRDVRIQNVFFNQAYKKIGIFPAGQYTKSFLKWLKENYDVSFECYVYDNNPALWGTELLFETKIRSTEDIISDGVEKIVVVNYNYVEEIYQQLSHNRELLKNGIIIERLHGKNDVPWF